MAGAVYGAARERGGGDRSDVGAAPALVLRGRGEQVAGVAAELPAADATAAALAVRSSRPRLSEPTYSQIHTLGCFVAWLSASTMSLVCLVELLLSAWDPIDSN